MALATLCTGQAGNVKNCFLQGLVRKKQFAEVLFTVGLVTRISSPTICTCYPISSVSLALVDQPSWSNGSSMETIGYSETKDLYSNKSMEDAFLFYLSLIEKQIE
jgi:hypothetical protein